MMSHIIIRNGFILTMDKESTKIPKGVVEISDDRISYVGSGDGYRAPEGSHVVIDAKNKVVMPGLINAHTHLCMTFARTVCYELNLLDWISKVQFPLMDQMGDEEFYLVQLIGYIENLKNGNTTVVDNMCASRKRGANVERANAEAAKTVGLRAFLALCFADQNQYEHGMQKPEEIVTRCREAIEHYHQAEGGRLKTLIGPEMPWLCSDRMFRETVKLAKEYDIGIHMHANENPDWNALGMEAHGVPTNLGIFKKYGCLGPNTKIAAMRVISDEDVAMLAESGTSLIHDPAPTLNRGWGLPSIPKLQDAGVQVGLCTNALGQDMFEAIRVAGWLARTTSGGAVDAKPSPHALPLEVALKMATLTNATIFGIDKEVGSLEVGKKADVITVNVSKAHQAPCLNVLAGIALCSSGGDVEEVVADGKLLVKEGKLTQLDEESILQEAFEKAMYCAKKANLDSRLLPISSTD